MLEDLLSIRPPLIRWIRFVYFEPSRLMKLSVPAPCVRRIDSLRSFISDFNKSVSSASSLQRTLSVQSMTGPMQRRSSSVDSSPTASPAGERRRLAAPDLASGQYLASVVTGTMMLLQDPDVKTVGAFSLWKKLSKQSKAHDAALKQHLLPVLEPLSLLLSSETAPVLASSPSLSTPRGTRRQGDAGSHAAAVAPVGGSPSAAAPAPAAVPGPVVNRLTVESSRHRAMSVDRNAQPGAVPVRAAPKSKSQAKTSGPSVPSLSVQSPGPASFDHSAIRSNSLALR